MRSNPGTRNRDHRAAVREQLSALTAISDLLTSSRFELDPLLKEIVRITAERMGARGCTIALRDEAAGEMVIKAVHGLSPDYLDTGPVIPSSGEYRRIVDSGKVHQIPDISRDKRIHYSREALGEGITSQLSVGLLKDSEAIGILTVYTEEPHHFSEEELQIFETIGNQVAAAVYLAQLHSVDTEYRRVVEELSLASKIQQSLLPETPSELDGVEIYARCRPCRMIGGDLYEFITLPDGNLGIGIGDVSGKGIPAALLMTSVCMLLRTQATDSHAVSEVTHKVNNTLCANSLPEQFTTLFYGVLERGERRMVYSNAGHDFPLLIRGEDILMLESTGFPVGMLPDSDYAQNSVDTEPGDLLVLYTDGYLDTPNAEGERFGQKRLQDVLYRSRRLPLDRIAAALDASVSDFEGSGTESEDDRTLVLFRFTE